MVRAAVLFKQLEREEKHQIDRAKIIKRDGYACVACGRTKNLHIHHLIKLSNGGLSKPELLITLCSECHARVECGIVGKAVKEYMERL